MFFADETKSLTKNVQRFDLLQSARFGGEKCTFAVSTIMMMTMASDDGRKTPSNLSFLCVRV